MNLATVVTSVIKPVVDKIFEWKSQQDKMEISRQDFELKKIELEQSIKNKILDEIGKSESELRKFALAYEGEAKDMPRFIQILRSSVRPVVTYWSIGLLTYIIVSKKAQVDAIAQNLQSIPDQLWWIFLAIFGFWFGGRAAMQYIEKKKEGDVRKQEVESAGKVREAEAKYKTEHARAKREYARRGLAVQDDLWLDDDDDEWGD